jgi:hypothetical protein
VFHYRNNVWTKRDLPTGSNAATSARGDLIYSAPTKLVGVSGTSFLPNAYVERLRLPVTDEFDTENVSGMVLLFDGPSKATISFDGTSKVGETADFSANTPVNFDTTTDYKAEVRFSGRFLNYKLATQSGEVALDWELTGYQIELSKGGSR